MTNKIEKCMVIFHRFLINNDIETHEQKLFQHQGKFVNIKVRKIRKVCENNKLWVLKHVN